MRIWPWALIVVTTFAAGWYGFATPSGGLAMVLALPGLLMGLSVFYLFAALANGWGQVLAFGAGLSAIGILGSALGEGIGAKEANGMFWVCMGMSVGARLIHLHVAPLWRGSRPE